MSESGSSPIETLDIHLTAAEAFPAFERLFLNAKSEIACCFRVFDLNTKLRSNEAKEHGETWFDLFEHTLRRGVNVSLVITDFDPIVATDYHRKSWESARQLAAVDELTDRGILAFRIAKHPARAGIIPRLLLRGKVREKLQKQSQDRNTPGLWDTSEADLFDLAPVTHHQKLAIFDQKTLYIGGLDLDERRFDTPQHDRPAEETWHDVQVVVTGPVVEAAQHHLQSFEEVVAGNELPAPKKDGFLRTLSARRWPAIFHISPKPLVNEIEEAHLAAVTKARRLLYFETQFLRHLRLADAIAEAATRCPDLKIITVLPAAPEDVAFEDNKGKDARMGEALQAEAIERIQDAFGDRALFCSPARRVRAEAPEDRKALKGSPIIYLHSKVSIFDDREAIVSSANLNGRSMVWDTEAAVHISEKAQVESLRAKLFSHWMPGLPNWNDANAEAIFNRWRETVYADGKRKPEARSSFLLPYDVRPARSFGKSVPLVPDELV